MHPDAPEYAAAWFDDRREPPPPKYTKSGDPPKYHRQPSTSEQRLLVNGGRAFEFLQSTCTKTTAKRDITVKLYGQDPEIDVPVYGKSARVEGTVALSFKPSEVSKVSVKIEGMMKLGASDELSETRKVVDIKCTIWARPSRNKSTSLPEEIPFNIRLPSHYTVEHRWYPEEHSIPPSCNYSSESTSSGLFAFQACVEYAITITVEVTKSLLSKKHTLRVPIRYFPRSRPPNPSLDVGERFLETLKVSPEEWSQTRSVMKARHNKCPPIEVHVVLPRGFVYPLNLPLPIHIQLIGRKTSHNYLCPTLSAKYFTITLTRVMGIIVGGVETFKPIELAHGELTELSPLTARNESSTGSDGELTKAWDGVINPAGDMVGTFKSGSLYMKDFLVVTIYPGDPTKSPFAVHVHRVPICLVSDHFDSLGMGEGRQHGETANWSATVGS